MTVTENPGVAAQFMAAAQRLGNKPALIRNGEAVSFAQLATDVERLTAGLRRAGIASGTRVALLIPPSRDLYACTFALFRLGAVPVFIDPGIGFANMGRCLAEAEPAAFIGSPKAHLARLIGRWAPKAKISVVADGKIPGMWNTRELRGIGSRVPVEIPDVPMDSTAAILFTSGSTGAPKGVVYTHAMFSAQVELLRSMFDIKEGEVSVPTFPLFGLFDVALGQTCIIPDMDFTRPADVSPEEIISCIQNNGAHQLFGSPALLDRVGRYGAEHSIKLPGLKRVLSAGAPVGAKVLERFSRLLPDGVEIHTPYGATEGLPVAVIGSNEILHETAAMTAQGRGVCVGLPVSGVTVEIIRIFDEPAMGWNDSLRANPGDIGEIVVSGPVVSKEYDKRPAETAAAKIADNGKMRHRMGDLGYFDQKGRLWFCGRKAHRVKTADGELYTIPVEGIFNAHPDVKRTALVGVRGKPVLCVEKEIGAKKKEIDLTRELLVLGGANDVTKSIETILYHPAFPVDIRHNAKIFREKLSVWAAGKVPA
jgi:acyl-CoA synthetase (AMP-forming)/AMP-acid ligase II